MKKKNRKKISYIITIFEQIKLSRPRTMIQQKPKTQSNKKLYKRDNNKNWKKDL